MMDDRIELHNLLLFASQRLTIAFQQQEQSSADPAVRLAVSQGSILRSPATSETIAAAEERLGIDLPADYKSFLQFSNGMVIPMIDGHVAELLRVEAIKPFSCADAHAFALWNDQGSQEAFTPLSQIPGDLVCFQENLPDVRLLTDAVLISDVVNSGGVLLCPFKSFGPDAFEIWELEPWAGCVRYRNFADFLRERIRASLGEWT
jgi:hypothetical protein